MTDEIRRVRLAGVAVAFLLLDLAAVSPTFGQTPAPVGPQALANASTAGNQDETAVAVDPNGNFLVVWRDELLDGNLSAIVGRRFSARTGLPLSNEFLINVSTSGDQRNPAIAMADDGHFAVVWEGPDSPSPPTSGIFLSLRQANGTAIVPELQVNTDATGLQRRPAIAMQPGGAFFVVWQDDAPLGLRGTSTGDNIRGRFFPANFPSGPALDPVVVNLGLNGDQILPAVAAVPSSGQWFVGWQGPRQSAPVVSMILARVVAGNGTGTSELEMNSSLSDVSRDHVSVAANAQSDAVAVWEAPDAVGRAIFARRIVDGTPSPAEEPVNLSPLLDDREPSVAIDARGGFVTVWVSGPPIDPSLASAPEGSPIVIQGRKKSSGSGFAESDEPLIPPLDAEFQISASGTNLVDPWVTAEARGNFVVAWQGVDALDPEGNGVFYRGFRDAIFADDLESGDTARWSNTAP